jgi:hypothetical protein
MANTRVAAAGRTSSPSDQRQTAEELGTARQQGHQVARRQAERGHELAGTFEAVAAKGAEQLLRAVGNEDDAHGNAQGQRAPAGVGSDDALQEGSGVGGAHGVLRTRVVKRRAHCRNCLWADKHA